MTKAIKVGAPVKIKRRKRRNKTSVPTRRIWLIFIYQCCVVLSTIHGCRLRLHNFPRQLGFIQSDRLGLEKDKAHTLHYNLSDYFFLVWFRNILRMGILSLYGMALADQVQTGRVWFTILIRQILRGSTDWDIMESCCRGCHSGYPGTFSIWPVELVYVERL